MRAFVTGGTGFIGGRLVHRLVERGDEVVALVRSPEKARDLDALGCRLVAGDLSQTANLTRAMEGCDSVFHVAAMYKVGIPAAECAEMHEANVQGTENVFDAAEDANIGRVVYVSTVGYFGNTRGEVVDESYVRPPGDFLSCYDETKYLAHELALDRATRGTPVVVAQPGGVYGPGDHSELGTFIWQVATGKLRAQVFPQLGFNLAHVDDVVDGLLLVHDKGEVGRSYVLGGQLTTIGELLAEVARLSGRKPPRVVLPAPLIRMAVPFGPLIGRMIGLGPNLREMVKASDGVTYWATDARARRELGYAPRDLTTGLRQTLADR